MYNQYMYVMACFNVIKNILLVAVISKLSYIPYRTWYQGLCSVVRGLKRQLQQSDRRIIWLKEQYLQLYYEEGCCGPLTVDAIRVRLCAFVYLAN